MSTVLYRNTHCNTKMTAYYTMYFWCVTFGLALEILCLKYCLSLQFALCLLPIHLLYLVICVIHATMWKFSFDKAAWLSSVATVRWRRGKLNVKIYYNVYSYPIYQEYTSNISMTCNNTCPQLSTTFCSVSPLIFILNLHKICMLFSRAYLEI